MNKIVLFFALSILTLANIVPVFADKVYTDVTVKERITVPSCPATQQTPKLVHEQQDKDGNKIKIYCSQGRYLMQYITSSGTTYYVGGCFFDSGVNVIYKQVHYDKYTKFDNGTKKGENATFYRTWWHNFNAPQLPVRTATNASDYEFEFDPVTEILIKYNTVHNGAWVTGRDYHIINVTQISNKTITNPDDPQKLISYLAPRAGEMTTIPTDYAFTTPLPVTGYDNGKLSTVVFTQWLNDTFDIIPISAKVGVPFTFDINMPGEDLGVMKYSLSQAPDGMTIGQQNGIIFWLPQQEQSGNHDIVVKIQDGMGSALYKFTLPVEPITESQVNDNSNSIMNNVDNHTTNVSINNTNVFDKLLNIEVKVNSCQKNFTDNCNAISSKLDDLASHTQNIETKVNNSIDSNLLFWVLGAVFIPFFIAYTVSYYFKHNVKTKFEITWDKNRKSIIWYSLSTIDNEILFMKSAFSFLKRNDVDVNEDQVFIGTSKDLIFSSKSIQEQIDRLPGISNALGFMTHEQYVAITDYLGYSRAFLKSLEEGYYSKAYLILRAEKAKMILELFPGEEKDHEGLQEWKKELDSIDKFE